MVALYQRFLPLGRQILRSFKKKNHISKTLIQNEPFIFHTKAQLSRGQELSWVLLQSWNLHPCCVLPNWAGKRLCSKQNGSTDKASQGRLPLSLPAHFPGGPYRFPKLFQTDFPRQLFPIPQQHSNSSAYFVLASPPRWDLLRFKSNYRYWDRKSVV